MDIIQQCYLSACQLTGYEKQNIIGRSVDIIMPPFYTIYHQQALIRSQDHDQEYFKKKYFPTVYLRHRSGYVIPITLKATKRVGSSGNQYFLGQLTLQGSDRGKANGSAMPPPTATLLLDSDQKIITMTSSIYIYIYIYYI